MCPNPDCFLSFLSLFFFFFFFFFFFSVHFILFSFCFFVQVKSDGRLGIRKNIGEGVMWECTRSNTS